MALFDSSYLKGTGLEGEILQNIRVLDFSRVLAGPYATRILADFGAEVIKVQSKKIANNADSDQAAYYDYWNRNKKSMMLDMSHPEAREIILKLVALSDVVVENFSPRVMSNWGLDYKKLKAVKNDIIMLSMSGMGQTGPWKDFVAYGPTIQSLSGMTYLTSYDQDFPMGPGYSYADHVAGLYGTLSVLAALEYRDRTGEGQAIDISEYEAMCTLTVPALLKALSGEENTHPQGNRADYLLASPYGCYPCLGENNWCVICIFHEEEWFALCKIIAKPGWSKEERFSNTLKREKNIKEIDDVLAYWTSKHTCDEVVLILQKADIPAGIVQNAEDLANDPHLLEREFFVNLKHPKSDKPITERSPIRFRKKFRSSWKSAPSLGEDNHYVYSELLGFTDSQLSEYIQKGIIG